MVGFRLPHSSESLAINLLKKNSLLTFLLHWAKNFWHQSGLFTSGSGKPRPTGQIQPSTCLSTVCKLKMLFTVFKWLEKQKKKNKKNKRRVFHDIQDLYEIQCSWVLLLLEHIHTSSLRYCQCSGCFCTTA